MLILGLIKDRNTKFLLEQQRQKIPYTNITQMDYFESVRSNIGQESFNLVQFLKNRSPHTPVSVNMHELNVDSLRNCVLYNIMQQGLYICPETSRHIISFLEDDFSNSVKKIYLQVLVHYTKINVHQVYETYSSNFDKRPSGTKMNIDNYFDSLIKEFVKKAQQEEVYNVIKVTSEKEIQVVRTALLSPSIRSGFQTCLNDIMGFSCTAEWIKVKIEKMQIYTLDNFKPLAGLRGACLIDGILICKDQLAEVPGTKNFEADAVTLAAHECAHYLGRMMDGNFNWSTPFGNIAERQQDLVFPSINLEAGRTIELIIFDKIQPDWRHSSENSAIQFLERLKIVETCPILRAEEHNTLNLKSRICSIVSFGIDIENQFIDFY